MGGELVGQLLLLLLAIVPGIHYDRVRSRGSGSGPAAPPNLGRVILAGVLITTMTLVFLGLLDLFDPQNLVFPLDKVEKWEDPQTFAWTVIAFLVLSLTTGSLADALLSRLESGALSAQGTARSRAVGVRRQGDEDLELEVRLNSGDTYRGVVAGLAPPPGSRASYITLKAPIFELDGHGRPLPLDALHGDQLVLATDSIMSVLVRTADPKQTAPRSGLPAGQPRHSMPRSRLTRRVKSCLRRCYEARHDAHFLTQLLLLEMTALGFVALLSGSFA
ncbi:DUF6338 family protein [Spirillospora sp. NPDC048911]|uniref:DUF6338 family protein n=1 Tax=Spirillospora sp. NPDC048911 TaxID=3364527 RepID=UPI0037179DE0